MRGKVISIGRSAAFIDIGAKSDGVIDLTELRDADGKLLVQPMDELEARVVEVGGPSGSIVLKRLLGRGAEGKAELEQAFQLGVPVEGTVSGVNKGGVEVTVAGVRAFCPISQLDVRHVEDASATSARSCASASRATSSTAIASTWSCRAARCSSEEQATLAVETRKTLEPGAVVRGKVTTIKDYGAFVDLGGVEGMLHVSELGFQPRRRIRKTCSASGKRSKFRS